MGPDSWWNYRVVEHKVKEELGGGVYHSIHSVHYNLEGIRLISTEPVVPGGENPEDLKADLNMMLEAFQKEVLVYDEIQFVEDDPVTVDADVGC